MMILVELFSHGRSTISSMSLRASPVSVESPKSSRMMRFGLVIEARSLLYWPSALATTSPSKRSGTRR